MLGKEDVLLWFKDLESYQRINLMYDLLNMCMPFEVRFLGTCVEEIGKHSYQELRGSSIEANDVERLAKDPSFQIGVVEENTRHRTAVYMSVMHARNCSCANWYYRTLFRTLDPVEHVVKVLAAKEEFSNNVVNELLLLYTIGLYHPAFTFEQKTYFRNALFSIVEHCNVDVSGRSAQPEQLPEEKITRSVSSQSDCFQVQLPVLPMKTSSVMSLGDLPSHALSQIAPIQQNLLARFPSGPPEIRPFTAQSNTSLVRQTASPPHSRALSPQQTQSGPLPAVLNQSPLHLQPIPPSLIDTIIVQTPPLHLDSNLVTSGPLIPFVPLHEATSICVEEENHFVSEEKKELPWPNEQIAKQNGMRYNKNYYPQHEQLTNIKNDPDKPPLLHFSNSTSSSSSSRNQSPSETPAVTPHGPGRGNPPGPPQLPQPQQPPQDAKPRVNGLPPPPQFIAPPCDQPPPFSTVPSFTNFPPSVPQPPRNPNCCNCGGLGHTMVDCTSQSVEEITQTPYLLDYDSPTVPDNPPEK